MYAEKLRNVFRSRNNNQPIIIGGESRDLGSDVAVTEWGYSPKGSKLIGHHSIIMRNTNYYSSIRTKYISILYRDIEQFLQRQHINLQIQSHSGCAQCTSCKLQNLLHRPLYHHSATFTPDKRHRELDVWHRRRRRCLHCRRLSVWCPLRRHWYRSKSRRAERRHGHTDADTGLAAVSIQTYRWQHQRRKRQGRIYR